MENNWQVSCQEVDHFAKMQFFSLRVDMKTYVTFEVGSPIVVLNERHTKGDVRSSSTLGHI